MGLFESAFGAINRTVDSLVKAAPDAGPVPEQIGQAASEQGMGTSFPLGPGQPIQPAQGYSQVPRTQDYQTGRNIGAKPRSDARVSFDTLRNLIDSYDVAQIAISHRIDSLRSYDWDLLPMPGMQGDTSMAIEFGKRILASPDRELPFDAWLSKFLYDVFAFDAGCLYRMRNKAGQVIGLQVIDGTTIAPLLDGWGNRPNPPAEAFVQYVQGTVYNWLTTDDLIYTPYRPISNTPYGRSPIESVLLGANLDLRQQMYFLNTFTQGNIPAMFAIAPESWTPDQLLDFQATWDAYLQGDEAAKAQIKWVPGGTEFESAMGDNAAFNDKMAMWLMRKTLSAYHVTPSDAGFTEDTNRATGEAQEGVQERVADKPMSKHVAGILTRFLQDDLGLPLVFKFDLGEDDEDDYTTAQSDEIYIRNGVVSPSDIAEKRFGIIDPPEERIPRSFYTTAHGPIPVSSLVAASAEIDTDTTAPLPGTTTPALQQGALPIGQAATDPGAGPAGIPEVAKGAVELAAFQKFVKARRKGKAWRDFEFTAFDPITSHRLNTTGYAAVRKDAGLLIAAGLAVVAQDTGRVLMLQRALDPGDPAGGYWEFPGGHIEAGENPLTAAAREWQEETGCPLPAGTVTGQWESPNGIYGGFVYTVPTEAAVPCRIGATSVLNPDDPDGDCVETLAWWDPRLLIGNPSVRPELALDMPLVYGQLVTGLTAEVPTEDTPMLKGLSEVVGLVLDTLNGTVPVPDRAPVPEAIEEDGIELTDGGDAVPFDGKEPCACCGGSGEHTTGRECYGCDASGLAEFYSGSLPCDGATPYPDVIYKGWRDTPDATPQMRFDVPLTDHYAPLIRDAVLGVIDKLDLGAFGQLVSKAKPTAGDVPGVADEVRRQVADLPAKALTPIVDDLYSKGYAAGEEAGAQQLGPHVATVKGIDPAVLDYDWDDWTPGDGPAADAAADGGLAALLDEAGVTIRGISDTLLDRIGDLIAQGLLDGDSIASIGRSLRDDVGSTFRAEMIAHTESTRAVMAATRDVWQQNGVGLWDWVASEGACQYCLDQEANSPHGLNDVMPPGHPFCRCAGSPRAESIVDADAITAVDQEEDTADE